MKIVAKVANVSNPTSAFVLMEKFLLDVRMILADWALWMEDASPRVSTVARAETTNVFADLDMQEITVRNIEINVNFGNSYYRSLIMIGENILSIKGWLVNTQTRQSTIAEHE